MNIDELTIKQARELASLFSQENPLPTTSSSSEEQEAIAVVVWTDKRGVIFGYTTNPDARPITLTNARMCLYWPEEIGGAFGLCDIGPNKDTRVSATIPSADFEGVTGVARVSNDAENAWLNAPVQGREND